MQKGTVRRTFEEFSSIFENTGSVLFAEAGEESLVLGCRALSRYSEEVLPAFWEMVTEPGLRNKEFNLIKREEIAALQAESTDPGSLANRHFSAQLFGKAHPAGRFHSAATIRAMRLEDIVEFHRTTIVPQGALLVVAGDFSAAAMTNRFRPLFEGWNPGSNSLRTAQPPASIPAHPGRTVIRCIEKNDLTQVSFMVGHLLPGELHPQHNHIAIVNHILGGGNFSSRLMAEVRTRLGHSYSASSHVATCRRFGILTMSAASQTGRAVAMLEAALAVYRGISEKRITADELDKAKRFAVGNLAFQLEGIGNLVEKLLWLKLFNREQSYIENFASTVEAIDLDAVNQAVAEHFSSKSFVIVAVGQVKKLAPAFRSLGEVREYHFRDTIY